MKKILAIILVLCTLCSLLSACQNIPPDTIDTNIENYMSQKRLVEAANNTMPDLEDIGGERLSYSYKRTNIGIYITETISLYVEYSPEEYEIRKIEMLSSYKVIDEETRDSEGNYLTPPKEFQYKGYSFLTCTASSVFPVYKSAIFVGYNDETHRLAYCLIWDSDHDLMFRADNYTDNSIIEYMDCYFYWNEFE